MTDNEQAIEELKARAEGMGCGISILHKTFNDENEWVDGELCIDEPNLPDEGDGGFTKPMALFYGPKAPERAATLLNALDPDAATLGHVIAKMKTIAGECVDGNHDNIARDDVVWLCIEIIRDFRDALISDYEWVLTLRRKVEK